MTAKRDIRSGAPGACRVKTRREEQRQPEWLRATSNNVFTRQPPGALRVGAARGHLLRCGSCTVGRPRSSPTPCIWPRGAPNAASDITFTGH